MGERHPRSQTSHYSYAAYADPAMAESFDRVRFGGPIGTLVHAWQAQTLIRFLGADLKGRHVLDVGTGTGRAALVIARQGAKVTGIDASTEMLRVAASRVVRENLPITLEAGDAHALRFADRSFDAAVSLRVIMHARDWRRCLAELCRVSRQRIVIDYPALASAALLQAGARRVSRALSANVEAYRVFSDRVIARELGRHGFRVVARDRQFALPIAVHKLIGSAAFTESVEETLGRIGIRGLIGSPVTLVAERCGSF
jgi:ubiquinone/menaquinone biosynthesis C-methylase UbiE